MEFRAWLKGSCQSPTFHFLRPEWRSAVRRAENYRQKDTSARTCCVVAQFDFDFTNARFTVRLCLECVAAQSVPLSLNGSRHSRENAQGRRVTRGSSASICSGHPSAA
jgi:hypothetical protein